MTPLPEEGAELPILRQFKGRDSHELRAMRAVARDRAAWGRLSLIDEQIDFDREMALVVTLGRVMSDDYGVCISRVWREGRHLKVEIERVRPRAGAALSPTAPYCVAVVPRCDLNVSGFLAAPPAGRDAATMP